MSDVSDWYKNIPKFTKYWFSATLGVSLLARIGLLKGSWLLLVPELVLYKFHIWRPLTALFFYPLSPQTGFHFMFNLYFLYNYSLRLETDHFKGSPGDYFFLLIFNWLCCVIVGMVAEFWILMDPMVLSVLYVWCQLNKETVVSFWFGTRFKAMYLPWVLLVFNFILSSGSVFSLVGIVVGHLYYFLKFQYPQELGGPSWLDTPGILKKYFPDLRGGVHGFGVPPTNQQRADGNPPPNNRFFGARNWGRGNVLGR